MTLLTCRLKFEEKNVMPVGQVCHLLLKELAFHNLNELLHQYFHHHKHLCHLSWINHILSILIKQDADKKSKRSLNSVDKLRICSCSLVTNDRMVQSLTIKYTELLKTWSLGYHLVVLCQDLAMSDCLVIPHPLIQPRNSRGSMFSLALWWLKEIKYIHLCPTKTKLLMQNELYSLWGTNEWQEIKGQHFHCI